MDLRRFYFAQPELFLVPIEHLAPTGMSEAYADMLEAERGIGADWIELFNGAMAAYFERVAELHRRAPASWFAPRVQNVFVVTDATRVRPYLSPLSQSSWLLYASDFDPEVSNLEFAAFQFVHAERLGQQNRMTPAVVRNFSYWMLREREETEAFAEAAAKCPRPDGPAFQRMGEAMPWIRRLYHARLRAPTIAMPEPLAKIEGTELIVPQSVQPALGRLAEAFETAAGKALKAFFAAQSKGAKTSLRDEICSWLKETRPTVVVVDADGSLLWDPKDPDDIVRLRRQLKSVGPSAAQSLRADLEVIGGHTDRFLGAVRDTEALPTPGDDVEQEGGVYLHRERKLIAYSLDQPGLSPLKEPAPPFHRWLLGARTVHEWGHLAEEAGLVGLPDTARGRHAAALDKLGARFDQLIADGPPLLGEVAGREMKLWGAEGRAVGELVKERFVVRMSDYLSNVLARRFLSAEELEAYVRTNVHTLARAGLGPLAQLVRYAYEYQYLRLSGIDDPLGYFVRSTWFPDFFITPGLMKQADLEEVFEAAADVCSCYAVDEAGFR